MRSGLALFLVVFAGMAVLHQDFWSWSDPSPVFGVVPVGLAYHAGYSVLSVIVMAALVRFAWPSELEEPAATDRR